MRPYPPSVIERVRDLTRPFVRAHGEPVAWGAAGAAALGIDDPKGQRPDFGGVSEVHDGEVPVYWGASPSDRGRDSSADALFTPNQGAESLPSLSSWTRSYQKP